MARVKVVLPSHLTSAMFDDEIVEVASSMQVMDEATNKFPAMRKLYSSTRVNALVPIPKFVPHSV